MTRSQVRFCSARRWCPMPSTIPLGLFLLLQETHTGKRSSALTVYFADERCSASRTVGDRTQGATTTHTEKLAKAKEPAEPLPPPPAPPSSTAEQLPPPAASPRESAPATPEDRRLQPALAIGISAFDTGSMRVPATLTTGISAFDTGSVRVPAALTTGVSVDDAGTARPLTALARALPAATPSGRRLSGR